MTLYYEAPDLAMYGVIYEEFLRQKRLVVPAVGKDVPADTLHPVLFPFQRDLTRWAIRKGRCALFADTGLGKTLMQLDWARHVADRALIVAPLSVARQTVAEGEKWGIPVIYARSQEEVAPTGITICNYEMLDHFDPTQFGAVVLDECFAAGTEIDTPTCRKHIEDVIIGEKIINASGVDTVVDIHRREVSYAVRITVNGQSIISSPNHPYFTRRGWIGAQDLIPGDEIMATAKSLRVVRGPLHSQICSSREDAVLRSILLSEMADAPTRACGEGAYTRSSPETWREEACLACVGQPQSGSGERAHQGTQSDQRSSGERKNIPHIESHEAQTFRAWGQRNWFDTATADTTGCTGTELDSGIRFVTGSTSSRLSYSLQVRLSQSRAQNQYRGGWSLPSQQEGRGCQEGFQSNFARVARLEVLEPGHSDLESLRDADGKLYFYDIGATRHPSFSVNGLLVHNSSILKNFEGKVRTRLIQMFQGVPLRLCCTATPAPNDISEIANHAEFLGIMTRAEMLASFFVHDDSGWRLKKHAAQPFYRWLASWGMSVKRPSDLGYSDEGYVLPLLEVRRVLTNDRYVPEGQLFHTGLKGITDRSRARRGSMANRVRVAADLINGKGSCGRHEQVIAWVGMNEEGRELATLIPDSVLVEGQQSPDEKQEKLEAFISGEVRVLVTKCRIAGMGLNLQNCHTQVFVGLSDSFEAYYQAIRRSWRFGQEHPVNIYIVTSPAEEEIVENVRRKELEAEKMSSELVKHVAEFEREEIERGAAHQNGYHPEHAEGQNWRLLLGDSVERLCELETESVGLSVYSPPFLQLYVYSATERDLGNSRTPEQFWQHFVWIIVRLLRVTMPGRLTCVHVAQIPAMLARDGYIGMKDFRGDTIRAYQAGGWIYQGEVCIDKDPQAQAIRTHSKGLLFAQLRKDSSWLRPALADYILVFRKPGDNPNPIKPELSNDEWIEWARPIWYGIKESDTLNVAEARGRDDERHICPLQLGTIERCVRLWSNPGELVLDPFAGIGSTGVVALKTKRRFVGVELKENYYQTALRNLQRAEQEATVPDLFSLAGVTL